MPLLLRSLVLEKRQPFTFPQSEHAPVPESYDMQSCALSNRLPLCPSPSLSGGECLILDTDVRLPCLTRAMKAK